MKKFKLEIIVFLSGAIEMGLELLAARVLSPYVGSSNVVWTSIIGIILASMSLGYYVGGKRADKEANFDVLSRTLLYAGFATSIIPLFETIVVKNIANVVDNLIIAACLCAIIVFSIPSFILAMISPIAVKIKSENTKEIGEASGKISSLSTIGSIIGTFLMGFILIPHIGVSNINIAVTILLILLGLIAKENQDKIHYYSVLFVVSISTIAIVLGKYMFKKSNPDIILDVDSEYSRIWVRQVETKTTDYKILQVDQGVESYLDTETNEMGAEYLKYYDLFEYYEPQANRALLIGGAGYTYPIHFLNKYTDKTIDVVEIDKKMTQIAQEQFGLDLTNDRIKNYSQDGRSFLNYSTNKYDVVLIDAFKGFNAPFELTTYEAISNIYRLLNNDGILITNIISSIEGKDSNFIKYEYSTYKSIFDDVKVFQVKNADENTKQNLILLGIKGKTNEGEKTQFQNLLNNELKDFGSDKKIVTDDFAPIGN